MKHIAKRISTEYLIFFIYFASIAMSMLLGMNSLIMEINRQVPQHSGIVMTQHNTLSDAADKNMAAVRQTLFAENANIESMDPTVKSLVNRVTKSSTVHVNNQIDKELVEDQPAEPTNIVVEESIEVEPEVIEQELITLVADTSDVTKPSNATIDELNNAIKESCNWMYQYNPNLGEIYYNLEKEYGINAYFALSVSMSEVGVNKMSKVARTKNNTYGIMGKSSYKTFNSVEDCVDYFFRLINKYYIGNGRYSIKSISNKYCGGDPTWIKNVSYFMSVLPEKSRI